MHEHAWKIKYHISIDDGSISCTMCLPLFTCTTGVRVIVPTAENPEDKSVEEALTSTSKVSTLFKRLCWKTEI